MRSHIAADWAFSLTGAIQNVVRTEFPGDLRRWPLLQTFNFEAYHIGESYLLVVLRDKLSGVPKGPGIPTVFPFSDHPALPPTANTVAVWQAYLAQRFGLRGEDAAIIIPLRDSGRNVEGDYHLFAPEEQALWAEQLNLIVARQKAYLERAARVEPKQPPNVTFNVSGTNARVVINSTDASVNVVGNAGEVFGGLRNAVEKKVHDEDVQRKLLAAVDEMETSHGSDRFLAKYRDFMALAADHVSVFGPLLGLLAGLL